MVKNFGQNQVERLLDLVPYLTSNPGISLETIAADFKTNKESVIDDLNTLWMCGLPGYTPLELIDLSFETGFVSIRNADVLSKPRKLSTAEFGAVIVGLSILRESLLPTNPHYDEIGDLIVRMSSASHVPPPTAVVSNVTPEIRLKVEHGIKTNQNLSILYHSFARDSESTRKIIPFNVQITDNHEYVDSFCIDSGELRMFRLDRIIDAQFAGEAEKVSTMVNPHVDLRNFYFTVFFNARKISETFHVDIPSGFTSQTEFEATAYNDEWVIRTLCSLNSAAILSSPFELRKQIATRAEKALKIYL